MRINQLAATPNFRGVYVTTSSKNNGDYVDKAVIRPFQPIADEIATSDYAKEFQDIIDSTDTYVLAAGSGSRFKKLAQTQGDMVNKISFALPLLDEEGKPTERSLHMLDLPMAMAAPMMDENGLQRKNAEVARGSFAEVIDNAIKLREEGSPQKNVIVMCGDNLFDTKQGDPFELLKFCKDIINDPTKAAGLIGVERDPEDVVNRFGVLNVAPADDNKTYNLKGFREKPKTLRTAKKFITPNGKCIANTGMFVIKADAMEWLVDEVMAGEKTEKVKRNPKAGFIARSKEEPYDFAKALERIQEKYGEDKCQVRVIDTWEDAGEPEALYRTIAQYQKGHFLACLPKDLQEQIKHSMNIIYDGTSLLSSPEGVEKYANAVNLTKKMRGIQGIDGVFVTETKPLDYKA